MSQQKQTQSFFDAISANWQEKASSGEYNVIHDRHGVVRKIMSFFKNQGSFLDVGCGTGQLTIAASRLGWDATGVDFAQNMIDECKKNSDKENPAATFICNSIFESDFPNDRFDLISAQGFIEYISLDELASFLSLAHSWLKKDGRMVLCSRNRLFNIHSLNKYTEMEVSLNTIEMLLNESFILANEKIQRNAIAKLYELNHKYTYPQQHPRTSIDVDTRYQFSPADLICRLSNNGFSTHSIYPIHYHAFPVQIKNNHKIETLHNEIAYYVMTEHLSCHRLIPYSSSFTIEAVKK